MTGQDPDAALAALEMKAEGGLMILLTCVRGRWPGSAFYSFFVCRLASSLEESKKGEKIVMATILGGFYVSVLEWRANNACCL